MSLEELRRSVLEKAKGKARKIVEEAKERARKIVEEAKREYFRRLERERSLALRSLRDSENRKVMEKALELNLKLVSTKNAILKDIVNRVRAELMALDDSTRKESLRRLLKESLEAGMFGSKKVVVKVVSRDTKLISDVIEEEGLKDVVLRVLKLNSRYMGGVLVESSDGSVAVDNTYLTRLEKVKTILIKRLNDDVFKVSKNGVT